MLFSSVDVKADSNQDAMKMLKVGEMVKLASSTSMPDTDKYLAIEEAADNVRDKVSNHSAKVKVFFKTIIQSPTKAYEAFKAELTKETDDSSQGDYLYWDIKTEIPRYVCVPIFENGKVSYCYQFNISYKYYTTLTQKKKVDSKVKQIIKSFGFTSNVSNYKKIKTIYDYVCKNVQYASNISDDIVYTSYGALFHGKAVCQGYAQLMYKMLKEVNVPVRLIPGYAGGELHGWNIVKIGKYYYNIDSTWDSENYQRGYAYKNFLIGDKFNNHIRFDNYNSDEFYKKYPMAKSDYGKGSKLFSTKSKRAKYRMTKPKFVKIIGKKITLRKVESGEKYTIQYSKNADFKKAKKINTKKTKVTLSKLKKNVKYYVRFRAAKGIHGKTVYTKWSKKKIIILK